jgi:hypothetical protein
MTFQIFYSTFLTIPYLHACFHFLCTCKTPFSKFWKLNLCKWALSSWFKKRTLNWSLAYLQEGIRSQNYKLGMVADVNTTNNVTDFLKVNAVLLCVVNVIFTFVGTFLNSVVIISLLNSQLRRKLCYFMILVLACFDLAVVVVFHPFIIFRTYFCLLSMRFTDSNMLPFLQHLFVFSLTALLTMTLERYLASVDPFFTRNLWQSQDYSEFFCYCNSHLLCRTLYYCSIVPDTLTES